MSLIVLGEAATKVMDQHPAFAEQHKQIPWRSMRGMRNRIAANVRRVPALQI